MNKRYSSKSSLFLIELILAIFFFIIAMAVCLQLFVKSHLMSEDSIATTQSVLWTQNISEIFLGSEGDFSVVKEIYQKQDCILQTSLPEKNNLLLFFDQNWEETSDLQNVAYLVLSVYSIDNHFAYVNTYVASCSVELLTTLQEKFDPSILLEEPYYIHHLMVKKYIPFS